MPVLLEKRGAGWGRVDVGWNSCGGLGGNARFTMVSRGPSPTKLKCDKLQKTRNSTLKMKRRRGLSPQRRGLSPSFVAYFSGTVKSAIAAARRSVLLLEI